VNKNYNTITAATLSYKSRSNPKQEVQEKSSWTVGKPEDETNV
jgi:hypothetical protein